VLVAVAAIILGSVGAATAGGPRADRGESAPAPPRFHDGLPAPQDAEATVARLHELLNATDTKRAVVAFPNSRSRILTVDGNSDFFLYLERGNLRGTETINTFYQHLEAGDVDAAYETFVRYSLVSMRVSDFGWNGLGVPMATQAGSEIQDRYFKNVDGIFGPAEVTAEDAANYLEYIRDILIPHLEGADSP